MKNKTVYIYTCKSVYKMSENTTLSIYILSYYECSLIKIKILKTIELG